MSSASDRWGTALWLVLVILSVPFSLYAAVFVFGSFDVYKVCTTNWAMKNYDVAGLHILHHRRTWQIHAVAAEIFIVSGPSQYIPSLRKKYPGQHRRLGYVFVAAGTVLSISGILFMIPHSEFGTFGDTIFFILGLVLLYFLFIAVSMARQRKFQVHRKYMIRAAAAGNSVIGMRVIPALLGVLGIDLYLAFEAGTLLSPLLFLGLAELYIRAAMRQPPRRPPAGKKTG